MPENIKPIEGIEIVQPAVVKKGKVVMSFKRRPPEKMSRVIKALNYFIVGLMTMVGGSDLFSGGQAKIICFCLGVVILALGALELGTGVKPIEDKEDK